ncbi:uncharacterized protein LOC129194088 [Dunckerocampus dactyliophorus]|uniref:uncharacterized protein LOC129194088 n=1 Tax=Dunckerocampus dactyliophorus TaxID=161453 RepID=UPI00240775A4|nr:uncharacterized protein LOC129194088 [Dunckerocampus dactyliophorus]
MRMILLLVQLATCCAIGSAIKCYQCNLGASYFTSWDWSTKCTLTKCGKGDQCFITKDQSTGTYQVGCKAGWKDNANTKCCDTDGCNNWLDVAADAPAWKKLEAIKAACSNNNDLKACLEAISSTKTINCYQCDLEENFFTNWDWTTKCTPTPCKAGQQCSITKVSRDAVSYKMECKPACKDGTNTKCCDSDGCNNWLGMAATTQQAAVRTACTKVNNDLKECLDAIKTKTPSCYSCSGPLGADYFTSWDWSAQCTLTPCNAGDQCSVTKVSGAGTYQVGCKAKAACDSDDANTKCCNTDGCNKWLDVGEDADAWKKVEAIKAACSPSSNDPKDCLKAIDPNLISGGGGGLAGALGLPLVLAISVIVLVVLG